MKPGDLVQIRGDTAPMYAESDWEMGKGSTVHLLGYATDGSIGVLMATDQIPREGGEPVTFCLVLLPGTGPVWIRGVWVHEVKS